MTSQTSRATLTTSQDGPSDAKPKLTAVVATSDPEARQQKIAETAYFRAAQRGFEPGHEIEDWLTAEREVDTALTLGALPTGK